MTYVCNSLALHLSLTLLIAAGLCENIGNIIQPAGFDTIYCRMILKSIEISHLCALTQNLKSHNHFLYIPVILLSATRRVKEKLLNAYQSLYAAIVIGNAFHIGGILPVGDALLVKGAATQDKPWVRKHATRVL